MSWWTPRPSQPFIGLAIGASLGILVADRWEVAPWWPILAVGMMALLVLWQRSLLACCLLCAATFFELHTVRHFGSETRELAALFENGPRVVQLTGLVANEPRLPAAPSREVTARFRLQVESLELAGQRLTPSAVLNVSWAGPVPAYGDRVSLLGSATNLEEPRNPGEFQFAAYQRRQGLYTEVRARFPSDCHVESHGHGQPLQAFAFQAARWIERQLRVDLEAAPEISDLIASMILGLRGDTPDDLKALFQRTGTMHLFAVSGLNVAMLAAIVLALLRPFGLRRKWAVFLVVPILVAYALVTGLGASCVRATIMASFVLFAYVVDRRPTVLNSLGAAAFLILLWDTEQFFSPGFQFSFVLVLTIVGLAGKIQRRLEPIGQPDAFLPRELWSDGQRALAWTSRQAAATLGVTLAAWAGSLLFTAGYFHLFSLSAIVANLCAVPLAFGILILGLGSVLVAPWWRMGLVFCNNANWFCAKALVWMLHWFARIPGGYTYVEVPHLAPPPACEITVFDLGDGGAAHVRAARADWLVDCGSNFDYGRTILPYLRSRGVNRLDGLLLTHGDVRHIGSALSVLDDFHPLSLAESAMNDRSSTRKTWHAELQRRRLGKALYRRDDWLHLGSARVRVLYPPAGLKRSVADDLALVLQLESAGTRVLFMSDSGFSTEQWLLENEPDLRSDVLIKGQHSKDLSGTPDFLQRVHPAAIICTGPSFGATSTALDRWTDDLTAQGIEVFRQDQTGAVHLDLRSEGYELRAFVTGQAFTGKPTQSAK